jgi:hypothetical protein
MFACTGFILGRFFPVPVLLPFFRFPSPFKVCARSRQAAAVCSKKLQLKKKNKKNCIKKCN